eukprot:m.353031 g.353031  ORF g.353031 m.353031 type:complete len:207 (-) comp16668_c0_seq1:275-895(-)
MAESDFTLHYWPNFSGRSEPLQMILAYAEAKYTMQRDVKAFKESNTGFPAFACPILEHDGKVFAQTSAIAEYLGSLFNLIPTDAAKRTHALQMALNIADVYAEAYQAKNTPESKKAFTEARLLSWLAVLNKAVAFYPGKFAMGEELTYVDFIIFSTIRQFEFLFGSICPPMGEQLSALAAAVAELPQMVKFLETAEPVLYPSAKGE